MVGCRKLHLPDGSKIISTQTGLLPLPHLPGTATQAHIFPKLRPHSLLSVNCLPNGLWSIPFKSLTPVATTHMTTHETATTAHYAHAIIPTHNLEKFMSYLHASLFSPLSRHSSRHCTTIISPHGHASQSRISENILKQQRQQPKDI